MKTLLRNGFIAGLALMTTACFNTIQLDLQEAHEAFAERQQNEPTPAPPRATTSVAVAAVAGDGVGCVMVETPDEAEADRLGSYRCDLFQLPAGADADAVDDRADAMEDHAGFGFYGANFSPAFTHVLEASFGARFDGAKVRAVTDGAQVKPEEIRVELTQLSYYQGWAKLSEKNAVATLQATLPDGRVLTGTGTATIPSEFSQLGWMVPVGVVFFPIGIIPSAFVQDAIMFDHMQLGVWVGLDAASRELTAKVAAALEEPATAPAPARSAPGDPAPPAS